MGGDPITRCLRARDEEIRKLWTNRFAVSREFRRNSGLATHAHARARDNKSKSGNVRTVMVLIQHKLSSDHWSPLTLAILGSLPYSRYPRLSGPVGRLAHIEYSSCYEISPLEGAPPYLFLSSSSSNDRLCYRRHIGFYSTVIEIRKKKEDLLSSAFYLLFTRF